jgi:hypothetical protein
MEPFQDFAHTGLGTLAGQFIRHFWQPVMVSEDLEPMRPKRILVLGQYFTAYRGEDGAPHLVQDACAHRVSTDEIGLSQLPVIDASESDYGILRKGRRADDGNNVTRTAHIMMPNVLFTVTPASNADPGWNLHIAWRVPIDDETMASFILAVRKGGGGGLVRRPATNPDPNDITEEVLAGRLRVQDLDPDYRGLFNVQDNVALAGQGRITDRSKDRLGQSDKGVILLRQLWEREMKAIHQGRPIKDWRRPAESFLDIQSREMDLVKS